MTIKAKLMSSAAKAGSNSAGLAPPDERTILAMAEQAFTDMLTSETLAGTATQRLAAAIMCEHTLLADKGEKLTSLAMSGVGSEAFKELSRLMTAAFIGKPENTKIKDNDQTAAVNVARRRKVQLLGRSLKLAVTLAEHGVTFHSFRDDMGCFDVPSRLLVKKGDTAVGRLAVAKSVLLNNAPLAVMTTAANNNPKLLPIRASVTHLMMANTVTVQREGGVDADSKSLKELAKSLRDILCEGDTMEQVRRGDLPAEVWNNLAEICAWYDTTVNAPGYDKPVVTIEGQIAA